ncbi:hypothetical protein KUCAC02_012356 [Chaenocephalus aceratus]|uniref:Uncharacterized protein n=1 Tax=Chaenocephalus aceratus TaxID=36190 RepID=A0ACB9XAF2_CHAAC|nr:hypothetical protein KUCAC02_012356 [Chaenocephalus aceratus]
MGSLGPVVLSKPPELERAHHSLAPRPGPGDVSAITAKKRAAFNKIKQALYQKGGKFRLLFPARLQVSFEDGTFTFETPEDAHAFYNERVMGKE